MSDNGGAEYSTSAGDVLKYIFIAVKCTVIIVLLYLGLKSYQSMT